MITIQNYTVHCDYKRYKYCFTAYLRV